MFWFLVFAKTLSAFSKAGGGEEQRYPSSLHCESSEGSRDSTPAPWGLLHQPLSTAGRRGKAPHSRQQGGACYKRHLNEVHKQCQEPQYLDFPAKDVMTKIIISKSMTCQAWSWGNCPGFRITFEFLSCYASHKS